MSAKHTLVVTIEADEEIYPMRTRLECSENGGADCRLWEAIRGCEHFEADPHAGGGWSVEGTPYPCGGVNYDHQHYHRLPVGGGCMYVEHYMVDPGVMASLTEPVTLRVAVKPGHLDPEETLDLTPIVPEGQG